MTRFHRAIPFIALCFLGAFAPRSVQGQISSEALHNQGRTVSILVTVDSVSPGSVELAPGGGKGATISGGGLNLSGLALEVRKNSGAPAGGKVTAALKEASGGSSRQMTVRVKKGADSGLYKVTLKGPDTRILLPFQVRVALPKITDRGSAALSPAAVEPGAGSSPPAVSPEAVKKTGAAELKRRAAEGRGRDLRLARKPVPASPTTGPLSYTPTAPARTPAGSFGRRSTAAGPLSYTPTSPAEPESYTETAPAPLSRKSFGAALAPDDPSTPGVPFMVDVSHLARGGPVNMPEAVLEVRLLYGDMETWGPRWREAHARLLEFRWQSTAENITGGRWEVSQGSGPGSVIRSGDAGPAPGPGEYTRFRIDFREIAGMFNDFTVRVRPLRGEQLRARSGEAPLSPPVKVTVAAVAAGEPTEFTDPAMMDGPVILQLGEPETVNPILEVPEPLVVPLGEPLTLQLGEAPSVEIPLPGAPGATPPVSPGERDLEPGESSIPHSRKFTREGTAEEGIKIAFPSAGFVRLWKTKLRVRQGSGDFAQWGSIYTESDPMTVTFRWTTEETELRAARLQISRTADFSTIVKGAKLQPVPLPGHQQLFTVDFRTIGDPSENRPVTWHVRLLPRRKDDAPPGMEKPAPSNSVIVRITAPGPDTKFQMPTITDFMPFSSCSPGGAVILKGYDFGDQAGELKLMGDFPGGELHLRELEWNNLSVGGQVPTIAGVPDQQVGILLVTKDGNTADPVPCSFRATRETKTLPFPGGFAGRRCAKGDNADSGKNLVFPDVSADGWGLISDEMANGDVWFGCRHSNNSQGGDNRGTDTFTTVWLQNGWVFQNMTFGHSSSYVNHDPGQVLGLSGWKADVRQLDLRVSWFVPEGQRFRYSMKLYMEGPAGLPFK